MRIAYYNYYNQVSQYLLGAPYKALSTYMYMYMYIHICVYCSITYTQL